jgi:hypothetical protein
MALEPPYYHSSANIIINGVSGQKEMTAVTSDIINVAFSLQFLPVLL